jgi:hypothetical protein
MAKNGGTIGPYQANGSRPALTFRKMISALGVPAGPGTYGAAGVWDTSLAFYISVTSQNHLGNGCPSSSLVNAAKTGRASQMALWRIRINLADDPLSRERLNEVLASQRVRAIQLAPRPGTAAELSGDVVLELPRDDALGDMLTALHSISPQVFVSRVDEAMDRPQEHARPDELVSYR